MRKLREYGIVRGFFRSLLSRAADRRQRRLVPTERLIEQHRQRWTRHFEAMALIMPEEGRKSSGDPRPA
jgi:hypothetical protein